MVPACTISTSVVKSALCIRLTALVFVESPTAIILPAFSLIIASCNMITVSSLLVQSIVTLVITTASIGITVVESHVPTLIACFSPAPPWFASHQFSNVDVIEVDIVPWIGRCCCVNDLNILPDFRRSFQVGMSINGCVYSECLVPLAYVTDFPSFYLWRFQV